MVNYGRAIPHSMVLWSEPLLPTWLMGEVLSPEDQHLTDRNLVSWY